MSTDASVRQQAESESKVATAALYDSRRDVIARMETEAELDGADAVVTCRFDITDLPNVGIEICVYGTAVTTTPRP